MSKINPCPMCNEAFLYVSDGGYTSGYESKGFRIGCNCGYAWEAMGWQPSKENAVAIWNALTNAQKEIHFYEYFPVGGVLLSWADTEKAIFAGATKIYTVQMGCLIFAYKLFEEGYRVYIHESDDSKYEIKLGGGNERTNRYLKISHNFFKLWVAGEFERRRGIIVEDSGEK